MTGKNLYMIETFVEWRTHREFGDGSIGYFPVFANKKKAKEAYPNREIRVFRFSDKENKP